MKYSREQLIDALYAEHVQYCDECGVEDADKTPEEMLAYYKTLTLEELIKETSWDTEEQILDFIYAYDQ